MPGSIIKQIIGKIGLSKTTGKAYQDELDRELSPEAIAKEMPETQDSKKK